MKILHIFDDYGEPGRVALPGNGSVSEVVYNIAKYAADKGHEVTIIERDFSELLREEEIDGIRYVRFCAGKLPKAPYELIKSPSGLAKLVRDGFDVAGKVNRFVKENDFDVVHAHFPFASSVLVNLNRGLRNRMVYTAHADEYRLGLSEFLSPPFATKIFSPDLYLMKRVRKSVVLNETLKNKLVNKKGIDEDKLEVIPNGINVDSFKPTKEEIRRIREKYGLNNKVAVMFSGNIIPRKGVEYLIRAGELLKSNNVLFLIVGSTNLNKEYANRVMEYARGKGVNAKFTGFIPYQDLKTLYSACDIFALPSLEEGHGIVLTEAMASGKPLIGSNIGGIPAQVKDGWNGFLVEPGNEKQLAEKIKIVDNPEGRERMGENSRRLAKDEFDWEKIAERYLEVYEEIAR